MVSGEVLDTFHPAGARRVAPSRHPETITESEKTMWSAKGKVYGQSSCMLNLSCFASIYSDQGCLRMRCRDTPARSRQ